MASNISFIHPNTLLVIIISIISVITDLFCSMTVCSIVIVTLLILEVSICCCCPVIKGATHSTLLRVASEKEQETTSENT